MVIHMNFTSDQCDDLRSHHPTMMKSTSAKLSRAKSSANTFFIPGLDDQSSWFIFQILQKLHLGKYLSETLFKCLMMFKRFNTVQPPNLEYWEICNRWKSLPRPRLSEPNATEYSFPNVSRTWTCWNQPANAWSVCLFRRSASAQFVNHCDTSSPLPEAWLVSSTLCFVLWLWAKLDSGKWPLRQL